MDVHSAPVAAKRTWGYLRAVFFMMRKGVLSKRKLLVGMHLVMKRRNKAVARSVANLLSHHGHGHGHALRRREREYEFSCSGSPGPAAFSRRRPPLAYFPCLGADDQVDGAGRPAPRAAAPTLHRIEYYAAASSPAPSSPELLMQDLASGVAEEEDDDTPPRSPLLPTTSGAFSVRVSDFSSEEYGGDGLGSDAVDEEAEEFIARFYEQLRRQNHLALLP